MSFEIQPNMLDLKFRSNPTHAFWVGKTACPTQASQDPAFTPIRVYGNAQKLEVENKNLKNETFMFSLNFDSSIGPLSYDPIIKNLNATGLHGKPRELTKAIVLAVAVAGTIAALFGLKSLFDQDRDRRR